MNATAPTAFSADFVGALGQSWRTPVDKRRLPKFDFSKATTIDKVMPLGEAPIAIDPSVELQAGESFHLAPDGSHFNVYGADGNVRATYELQADTYRAV